MYDSTYDCGLSDKNNLVEYLFFEDTKSVLKTMEKLNYNILNNYEIGTYSFTKQMGSNTDKHIIKCLVAHPFWDEDSIPSSSWLESKIKNDSYEFVDLFNLQRRANEVHNSLK